jgi:uncharacterized protein
MTPQEQDLIAQLFARLKQSPAQQQDPEAAELIRRSTAQQVDAPYKLVQTVLVQDMALTQAQARIAELEDQLAGSGVAQPAPRSRSFLPQAPAPGGSPNTGPWGRAAAPGVPAAQPGLRQARENPESAASPSTTAIPGAMAGAGSGFLRAAAATALGVAGGQLLFQGVQSMFGHNTGGLLAGQSLQPALTETVVNNFYSDPNSASPDADVTEPDRGGPGMDDDETIADGNDAGSDSGPDDVSDADDSDLV